MGRHEPAWGGMWRRSRPDRKLPGKGLAGAGGYLVRGKPRSTFEVPGSGQRAVTTFARV